MDEYEEEVKEQRKREKSGYECSHCGYEPTWAEADRGICPQCLPCEKPKDKRSSHVVSH